LSKHPGTTKELGYLKEHIEKADNIGFPELTDEKATTIVVLDPMKHHD
jgi:hypothetical protein